MLSQIAMGGARLLPLEMAHRLAILCLKNRLMPRYHAVPSPRLEQKIWGIFFANPLGLAAGFDKNAEAILGAARLGFGFSECGTITPLPQAGNPAPRVFRLNADHAVINRYGFNNQGADIAAANLARQYARARIPIGVNIGANKDSTDRINDYHDAATRLAAFADYLTINVSSPNTPHLRDLETPKMLGEIMGAVRVGLCGRDVPILVKLSPDMCEHDFIAVLEALPDLGAAGVILTNTTMKRPQNLKASARGETGGLSGAPLLWASTEWLVLARRYLGENLVLVGVGGVDSAAAAYAKILAGANLVQLYTALALQGPRLPCRIINGLDALLARDGTDISGARGQAKSAGEALAISSDTT